MISAAIINKFIVKTNELSVTIFCLTILSEFNGIQNKIVLSLNLKFIIKNLEVYEFRRTCICRASR